jgi:hypothetical protein
MHDTAIALARSLRMSRGEVHRSSVPIARFDATQIMCMTGGQRTQSALSARQESLAKGTRPEEIDAQTSVPEADGINRAPHARVEN